MQHKRKGLIIGGVVVALLFAALALRPTKAKAYDLVNGIQPVSDSMAGIRTTIEELVKLSPEQRTARLKKDYPRLEQGVVYYLHQAGKLMPTDKVTSVKFYFGSLNKARAEDKSGAVYDGYFENQLLADVAVQGRDKPVTVLVKCLNGTFLLPEDFQKLQDLGTYQVTQQFTIEPGRGLVSYVDYPVAMDLAERHGLRLYRGRRIGQNPLSVTEARLLEKETDRVQVTVAVKPGDRFNLATDTYNEAR